MIQTINRYFYKFTAQIKVNIFKSSIMVNSTATELILHSQFIYPRTGTTLVEHLSDCYKQLTENSNDFECIKSSIVKQTIFISIENNDEYIQIKQKLLICATDFFGFTPSISIIPQAPENGLLALELTKINGLLPSNIIYRQNNNNSWLIIKKGELKMLFASGFSNVVENSDVLSQSIQAFKQLEEILIAEEMEFSDIVRQWNYIEKITKNYHHNGTTSQHYQIFNDVRSKYYEKATFSHGYPAATGIGMDFGGIIIDILATKSGKQCSVVPIKSPVQLDAYKYSKEVLAQNNTMNDFCRTTPKFERAQLLVTPNCKCLFVSGTAAIKGQQSISVSSIEEQTELTIQNILSLLSAENLQKKGINVTNAAILYQLRVYVKNRNDIHKAKGICLKYFPSLSIIYLVADICRPELLVEIEGQAALG